ncbi:hypothetical protein RYX36_006044 [Vicia faba]
MSFRRRAAPRYQPHHSNLPPQALQRLRLPFTADHSFASSVLRSALIQLSRPLTTSKSMRAPSNFQHLCQLPWRPLSSKKGEEKQTEGVEINQNLRGQNRILRSKS